MRDYAQNYLDLIGRHVRLARRRQGLRQAELAALANVGVRFVSDLENGKPGLDVLRVLRVCHLCGLVIHVESASVEDVLIGDVL